MLKKIGIGLIFLALFGLVGSYTAIWATSYEGVNGFRHKVGVSFDYANGKANGTYRLDVENPCVDIKITTGRVQTLSNGDIEVNYLVTPYEFYHTYTNATMDVDITLNSEIHNETITLSESGNASGKFVYNLSELKFGDISYSIKKISGTVSYHSTDIKKVSKNGLYHLENNNLWFSTYFKYKENSTIEVEEGIERFTINKWGYRVNHLKTLYITDTLYTESGAPINYKGYGLCSGADDFKPIDFNSPIIYGYYLWENVETLVLDGTFEHTYFYNIERSFPHLRILYIKNFTNVSNIVHIPFGLTVYLGDECFDSCSDKFSANTNVRNVKHASEFEITKKIKNNRL